MIYETLRTLVNELNNQFFEQFGEDKIVVLDNIALADTDHEAADGMKNKVVASLLTIDEEATLRNFPNRVIRGNKIEYKNPKVNLNLYVLFSANATKYENSLRYVSAVIAFFQMKSVFTQNNAPYGEEPQSFRISMDLYTPNFEDLNYIWGTLGGKQFPSALYKVTLVTIEGDRPVQTGGLIENIGGEIHNQNQ